MSSTINCDLAIVGGGLSGGLLALALKKKRPDLDVRIVEGSGRIGGNHLWSFFASDVASEHRWLVAPLICHGWTAHDVRFPSHARTLKGAYYAIESDRLDQLVREALPAHALLLRRKALGASARSVMLADGDRVQAKGVIDCRGAGDLSHLDCGWQKFLGRELELADQHDLARPVIMDATVEQHDGYRFVYALPFAATRIFVEDTYYSDTAAIDQALLGARLDGYCQLNGWRPERIVRHESGALPVVLGGDFEAYWRSGGQAVAKAGVRAGLFHPLTSYSLPDAVRTAVAVAEASDLSGIGLHNLLYERAKAAWKQRGFYRLLSAMLFRAAEPAERYRILERFYRLDAGLIARFYAGQSTLFDRARVLSGRPPVPLGRAVQAIRETRR